MVTDTATITPPAHPLDREFKSPSELKWYVGQVESYLAATTAQIDSDPYNLARQVEQKIGELTALCLAIGSQPDLAQQVADVLLREMASADVKLSNARLFATSDKTGWRREFLQTKAELWDGAGFFPISEQVDSFIDHQSEIVMITETLFGLNKNPSQSPPALPKACKSNSLTSLD
jgi:hypothetical protein